MDRPTLRQLEAFDAIVRSGSFRSAARELGVSQVAVSDHIRELEQRLGILLFDRSRGGKARLSATGELLLPKARLVLADCDALLAVAKSEAANPARYVPMPAPHASAEGVQQYEQSIVEPVSVVGDLQASFPLDEPSFVGAAGQVAEVEYALESDLGADDEDEGAGIVPVRPLLVGTHPSIFVRFRQDFAAFEEEFGDRQIAMDFDCFVVDQVALAFSEERVDLALFYGLGETRLISSTLLWGEQWSLFISEEHPLAGREYVGRQELAAQSLLLFSPANRLRALQNACLDQGGLGGLPVAFESNDYRALADRCRAGEGILPLFGGGAQRIAASPGIRTLDYAQIVPPLEVRLALHPEAANDSEVQALAEMLRRGMVSAEA